jgi:ABC-type uncharacterized transport system permease subunit
MLEQIFNIFLSADFYQAVLRMTAPVLLAAMGGLLSERAGIITFSMESMLLMGTAAGVIGSGLSGSAWIGVAAAMFAGILMALLYAFMVVTVGADQVVTAVAMNLGAIGLSSMVYTQAFAGPGGVVEDTILVDKLPGWQLPLIGNLPLLGETISDQLPLAYLAFLMVPVVWFILYRTTWGLKIRAVGEHPHAADVLGISVVKTRYLTLVFTGALAGMAGAYLSVGLINYFATNMTGGRGFIAYTAIVFGRWEPIGVLLASLLFGTADALQLRIQSLGLNIPSQLLVSLPYVVTLIALVLFVGRGGAPAAYALPWRREEK